MSIKKYRILFASLGISLVLVASFALLSSIFPYDVTGEKFYVLSILGKNGTAESYYPQDNSSIHQLEEMKWHILVQNFMQTSQYVVINVKILNSTMTGPDLVTCTPSPEPILINCSVLLINGQPSMIPFFWSIANYSVQEETLTLKRLVINDIPIDVEINSRNASTFRMVFELWHFDLERNEFRFDWDSESGNRSAWNQMIFNMAGT